MNIRQIISIGSLTLFFAFVTIVSVANPAQAASNSASNGMKFNKNLSYGIKGSADVKDLQDFLSTKGFLKASSTSNYFDLTTKAVKSFQTANKIPATGFFGPMTRTAANAQVAGTNQSTDATLTITSHKGGEQIEVGNKQTIKYSAKNYTAANVKVNVIKQIGSKPNRYELIRTVSASTSNDGSVTWVPSRAEIGSNILLEVGCTDSVNACHAGVTSATLAVVDSAKYKNTASVFDAIEQADNK